MKNPFDTQIKGAPNATKFWYFVCGLDRKHICHSCKPDEVDEIVERYKDHLVVYTPLPYFVEK